MIVGSTRTSRIVLDGNGLLPWTLSGCLHLRRVVWYASPVSRACATYYAAGPPTRRTGARVKISCSRASTTLELRRHFLTLVKSSRFAFAAPRVLLQTLIRIRWTWTDGVGLSSYSSSIFIVPCFGAMPLATFNSRPRYTYVAGALEDLPPFSREWSIRSVSHQQCLHQIQLCTIRSAWLMLDAMIASWLPKHKWCKCLKPVFTTIS